jgi:hypothetical protein
VGERTDGLTTIRIVVECKAWSSPIDKEVVFKLRAELDDLGGAKGVIAALGGWTPKAELASGQTGIDLWGPEELVVRLGRGRVDELRAGPARTPARGWKFKADEAVARERIEKAARGALGVFGREETAWIRPVWMPVRLATVAVTRMEGPLRRTSRVRRTWNLYESLTGCWAGSYESQPDMVEVDLSCGWVKPMIPASKLRASLTDPLNKWRAVSTETAKSRHAATLQNLGIDVPLHSLDVEDLVDAHLPLWVGSLSQKGRERIVAVDGQTGNRRDGMGTLLTANVARLRQALGKAI